MASDSAGLLSALALTSDSPCVETVLVVCVCGGSLIDCI